MKYTSKSRVFTPIAIGISIILFIAACTSEKQYKVLSFFFDGVPNPKYKTTQVVPKDTTDEKAVVVASTAGRPEMYQHKPYAEEKCKSCHEEGFSNALLKPVPDLCFTCHKDFDNQYKTLHGPVTAGACLMCHNPHESTLEKLAERPGQDLCLYCHDSGQVFKSRWHGQLGNKNCTECHNPHGGDNRGFLVQGTCSKCHEPFSNKYEVLHGPVASGNCSACHTSHSSPDKDILARQSQDLCLYCHNSEQVANNPAHKKIKKAGCTDCHNPHGGSEHFMLLSLLKEKEIPHVQDNHPVTGQPDDSSKVIFKKAVPDSVIVK